MRALWTGDTVDHHGSFYEVENAKLFDAPASTPPVIVSGFGPSAAELAGRIGDGYWGHAPDAEVIDAYRRHGGDGPMFAQLNLCYGPDAEKCRETVHRVWPNAGIPGQLSQDLPTWTHFEQAAQLVTVETATEHIPCGPDLQPLLDTVRTYRDAGYDRLYFHQIGPDQDAFFAAWEGELASALQDL
jgi:G6PDH family F420-dependent oxidoreductase